MGADQSINSSGAVAAPTREPTVEPRGARVTGRALWLGALGAAGMGLLAPWAVHVIRGSYLAMDFSTAGAVALLFFVVAGPNLLLFKLRRRLALSTTELIVIYSMMIVASALPTSGLVSELIPTSTAAHYYTRPENRWAELVLPYIPSWLAPQGAAPDAPVITNLYEGLPAGASVPWGAWTLSLGAWLAFLLCLYLATMCMMVLLRKQWVENERLAYPLTYLPLVLTGADSGGRPTILRNWLFWIGMALPFVVGAVNGLHAHFPAVPRIGLAPTLPIGTNVGYIEFRLSFPLMGFFYLVNLETSFSLWFFSLLGQFGQVVMNAIGIASQENLTQYGALDPFYVYLGGGAFLALVATNLWVARGHLRIIWQRVTGRLGPEVDNHEVVSYRVAFAGMIIGLVVMGWWLAAAGLPVIVVPIFLVLAMALLLGLTRVVVESGMAVARAPAMPAGLTAGLLGWQVLGARGVVVLAQTLIWFGHSRTFVMASVAHSLKMAGVIRQGHRRLWLAFWVAIVLALVGSIWLTVTHAYAIGGTTMNHWAFHGGAQTGYKWAADWNTRRPGPSVTGMTLTATGAVTYLLFTAMRFRFSAWPFHPIGIALGFMLPMEWAWFPCFLSWLIKGGILRYGGVKVYDAARPLFLGFICGQFTTCLLWVIIDWLTGHTGNILYYV